MVTHNIGGGRDSDGQLHPVPASQLGLILENKLPYRRDAKSPEFQRLVDTIHETITILTLPDQPPEPPPAPGRTCSRAHRRMQSIPVVTLGQILGLISILYDGPQPATRRLTTIRRGFQTMIAWGRYPGIMDYNPNSKKPCLSRTTRKCYEVN